MPPPPTPDGLEGSQRSTLGACASRSTRRAVARRRSPGDEVRNVWTFSSRRRQPASRGALRRQHQAGQCGLVRTGISCMSCVERDTRPRASAPPKPGARPALGDRRLAIVDRRMVVSQRGRHLGHKRRGVGDGDVSCTNGVVSGTNSAAARRSGGPRRWHSGSRRRTTGRRSAWSQSRNRHTHAAAAVRVRAGRRCSSQCSRWSTFRCGPSTVGANVSRTNGGHLKCGECRSTVESAPSTRLRMSARRRGRWRGRGHHKQAVVAEEAQARRLQVAAQEDGGGVAAQLARRRGAVSRRNTPFHLSAGGHQAERSVT